MVEALGSCLEREVFCSVVHISTTEFAWKRGEMIEADKICRASPRHVIVVIVV